MNNVVDRVPTQVLANGAIRYETFDSSGTSQGYLWIKRADDPSEAGTPLNKVLFDSIASDISSRLLISSKATTAEAQAGTNNTKYMTPKTTKESSQLFSSSGSASSRFTTSGHPRSF